MKWITVVVAVCFSAQLCFGATINVPSEQPTIQAGIDAATDGDSVLVAPGTYIENINLVEKNIVLVSASGPDATFIEPADPYTNVVTIAGGQDTTCVIVGFTVSNTVDAYGLYCSDSDPIIHNCDISSCGNLGDGAGIVCYRSGGFTG